MTNVSVIGTGLMGSAIVEGLLGAGHEVGVYNRTRARAEALTRLGARVFDTPAEALRWAELTILVLLDVEATRALLLSEDTRLAIEGAELLNVAATSPQEIISLAEQVEALGGRLSEVDITVYPEPVRERRGHYVLAGEEGAVSQWKALLGGIGEEIHYAGAIGSASQVELALYFSYIFNNISIAYAAAAFTKYGLPHDILLSILTKNPTLKVANAETLLPKMMKRDYDSIIWTIDNLGGSLDMVKDLAKTAGIPSDFIELVHRYHQRASDLGFGQKDVAAVYEAFLDP